MADAEARVLGAGDTVEVNGEEYRVSPIGLRQLHEVQREAVRYYKRQYLQTIADNLDLVPGRAKGLLEQKLDEVARWDVGDLPARMVYDVSQIKFSPKLIALLEKHYGELPRGEDGKRAVLATALDSGVVEPGEVEKASGTRPRRAQVPYDTWWVTAVYEGMVAFVLASLRKGHPDISKEQVEQWPLPKLVEVARVVERLTSPALGNT